MPTVYLGCQRRAAKNWFARTGCLDMRSGEAEVVELVAAFFDDLVVVDPDVALAGEDIDVGSGFPVGVGLAAVGIAEGEGHAGEFFVFLEKKNHDFLGGGGGGGGVA